MLDFVYKKRMRTLSAAAIVLVSVNIGIQAAYATHTMHTHSYDTTKLRFLTENHVKYHEETTDMLGGKTIYSFEAKVLNHVVFLDDNTEVVDVECDTESMRISVTSPAVAEFWQPGTTFTGFSDQWRCADRSGEYGPFIRAVTKRVSAGYQTESLLAGKPLYVIEFEAGIAEPQSCFEHAKVEYKRNPGPEEEEMLLEAQAYRRQLQQNPMAFANATQAHRKRRELLERRISKVFDKTLVNWNFDLTKDSASEERLEIIQNLAFCEDCYAYLGAYLRIQLDFGWASLEYARIAATARATFSAKLAAVFESESRNVNSFRLYPRDKDWNHLTSFDFYVWRIPIRISVSDQIELTFLAAAEAQGELRGPGIHLDKSITIGVEYTGSWNPIYERVNGLDLSPPEFDVNSTVSLRVTLNIGTRFSLWDKWDLDVFLDPWVQGGLEFEATNRGECESGQLALAFTSGLDGRFVINRPGIVLDFGKLFGGTHTFSFPGNFPVKFGCTLLPGFQVHLPGLLGCQWRTTPGWTGIASAAHNGPEETPFEYYSLWDDLVSYLQSLMGFRQRSLTETLSTDHIPMNDAYDDVMPPVVYNVECGKVGCRFWATAWSTCSADCGFGHQSRRIRCRSHAGTGTVLSMTACLLKNQSLITDAPRVGRLCGVNCTNIDNVGAVITQDPILVPNVSRYINGETLYGNTHYAEHVFRLRPFSNGLSVSLRTVDADLVVRINSSKIIEERVLSGNWDFADEMIITTRNSDGFDPNEPISVLVRALDIATQQRVGKRFPDFNGAVYTLDILSFTDVDLSVPQIINITASDLSNDNRVYFRFNLPAGTEGFVWDVRYTSGDGHVFITHAETEGDLVVNWPSQSNFEFSSVGEIGPNITASTLSATEDDPISRTILGSGNSISAGFYTAVLIVPQINESIPLNANVHVGALNRLCSGDVHRKRLPTGGFTYFVMDTNAQDTMVNIVLDSLEGDADLCVSRQPILKRADPTQWGGICAWLSIKESSSRDSVSVTHLNPSWGRRFYIAVYAWRTAEFEIAAQSYEMLDQGVTIVRNLGPGRSQHYIGSVTNNKTPSDGESGLSSHTGLRVNQVAPGMLSMYEGSSDKFYSAVMGGSAGVHQEQIRHGEVVMASEDYSDDSDILSPMIMAVGSGAHSVSATELELKTIKRAGERRQLDSFQNTTIKPELKHPGEIEYFDDISALNGNETGSLRTVQHLPDILTQMHQARKLKTPFTEFTAHSRSLDRSASNFRRLDVHSDVDPISPGVTKQTPLLDYDVESGNWSLLAQCQLKPPSVGLSDSCFTAYSQAKATRYYRVQIPPRSRIRASVMASADGFKNDAIYTISFAMDTMSKGGDKKQYDLLTSGSSGSFSIRNCRHLARDLFIVVKTDNTDNTMAHYDFYFDDISDNMLLCPQYSWGYSQFSDCSAECGKGSKFRSVFCTEQSGLEVYNTFCSPHSKPATNITCDMGECAWSSSDWSKCSVPCGGGSQTRLIECRNQGGHGSRVLDRNCINPPEKRQDCRTQDCPMAPMWHTAPWRACSKPCGGGKRTRDVYCVKVSAARTSNSGPLNDNGNSQIKFNPVPDDRCSAYSKAPKKTEQCNNVACAESLYEFVQYDMRKLTSGVPHTNTIPAGGERFYRYEQPYAAVGGICIRTETRAAQLPECTVAAEKRAAGCLSALQFCVSKKEKTDANNRIEQNQSPRDYISLANWAFNKPEQYDVAPDTCECFWKCQQCLEEARCNYDVYSAQKLVSQLCKAAKGCKNYDSQQGFCDIAAWEPKNSGDDAIEALNGTSVILTVANYEPGKSSYIVGSNRKHEKNFQKSMLPVVQGATDKTWSTTLQLGEQEHMMLWWGTGSTSGNEDTVNQLAMSIFTSAKAIETTITARALWSYPVSVSGSLVGADSTMRIAASDIQRGGHELIIELSCDRFKTPDHLYSSLRSANRSDASTSRSLVESLSFNGAGFKSASNSELGWNRVVRPALSSWSTPTYAKFSLDMTRLTITLPAIPNYSPTSNEDITLTLPSSIMLSDRATVVHDFKFTVVAEARDCKVTEWLSWNSCRRDIDDTTEALIMCGLGHQTRTRQIVQSPRGNAAGCPPLVEKRACNLCNECASVICQNGGICLQGQCFCKPGYGGHTCQLPPLTNITDLPYYRASKWSVCSVPCASGKQNRTVECIQNDQLVADEVCTMRMPQLRRPAETRICNTHPCYRSRLDLTLTSTWMEKVGKNALTIDATESFFRREFANAVGIAPSDIVVTYDGVNQTQHSATRRLAAATSSFLVTICDSSEGEGDTDLAPSQLLNQLRTETSDPSSRILSFGTLIPTVQWTQSTFTVRQGKLDSVRDSGDITDFVAIPYEPTEPINLPDGNDNELNPQTPTQDSDHKTWWIALITGMGAFALGGILVALSRGHCNCTKTESRETSTHGT